MTQCESSRAECILLCLAYSYLPSPWLADFSFLTDPALLISNGFFREVPDFLFGTWDDTKRQIWKLHHGFNLICAYPRNTQWRARTDGAVKKELCRHSKLLLLYFVEAIKSCGFGTTRKMMMIVFGWTVSELFHHLPYFICLETKHMNLRDNSPTYKPLCNSKPFFIL